MVIEEILLELQLQIRVTVNSLASASVTLDTLEHFVKQVGALRNIFSCRHCLNPWQFIVNDSLMHISL